MYLCIYVSVNTDTSCFFSGMTVSCALGASGIQGTACYTAQLVQDGVNGNEVRASGSPPYVIMKLCWL